MNALLVWQIIPEDTNFYLIENAPKWLLKCNGLYLNSTDMTESQERLMTRLSDALVDKANVAEYCSNPESLWAGRWAERLQPRDKPFTTNGTVVVVTCGLLL